MLIAVETDDCEELWIATFLRQRGKEIICNVEHEYIVDEFNWKGLSKYAPNLKKVISYIVGASCFESDEEDEDEEMEMNPEEMNKYAETIYGLLHARFIETSRGMKQIVIQLYKHHSCIDIKKQPLVLVHVPCVIITICYPLDCRTFLTLLR